MQEFFEKYINHLEAERKLSDYTVRNYRNDLLGNFARGSEKGFFQFLKLKNLYSLTSIDRNTIREYIAWLMQQGIKKPSISRKLSAIRSFYRFLLREEIIKTPPFPVNTSRRRGERSPFSLKLDKRLPDFLTIDEINRLLQAPDLSTPQGLRDRAFLELLYASGLRVSELASLDVGQLDLVNREMLVWGKGAKERGVLIGIPAAEALEAYIDKGRSHLLGGDDAEDKKKSKSKKTTRALFVNRFGGRLSERYVQLQLEAYAARVGITKRVHPHMLRHTFATHLLDGGADLRVVQELLGHASLSSTQIYTHVSKSQARKVYLGAHPLAKGKIDEGQ